MGLDPLVDRIAKDLNQGATSATFRLSGNRVVVGALSLAGPPPA